MGGRSWSGNAWAGAGRRARALGPSLRAVGAAGVRGNDARAPVAHGGIQALRGIPVSVSRTRVVRPSQRAPFSIACISARPIPRWRPVVITITCASARCRPLRRRARSSWWCRSRGRRRLERPTRRRSPRLSRVTASDMRRARAMSTMGLRLSMAAFRRRRNATSSVRPKRAMSTPLAFSMILRSSSDWRSARASRCRAMARSRAGASSAGRRGLSRNAITPAVRARSTRSSAVRLVHSTTGQPMVAVTSRAASTPSPSERPAAKIAASGAVSLTS